MVQMSEWIDNPMEHCAGLVFDNILDTSFDEQLQ